MFCAGVIYAATTIGTNISTDGSLTTSGANTFYGLTGIGGALTATSTLTVSGLTTLGNASSTALSVSGNTWLATTTLSGALILERLSSFPSSPATGQMFYSTASSTPYWYTGSSWKTLNNASTFTVCTADTKNKEKCDYIGDGADDGEQIMAAHTALPATGGEIKLLDGTFDIRSSNLITISKSNVTLSGVGKATHLKASGTGARQVGYIIGATGDDVVVKDMWLDGGAIDVDTTYATHGVFFDTGALRGKAEGLWINDLSGDGIIFYDDDGSAINNVVYDLTAAHCAWGETCTAFEVEDGSDRVTISNNLAYNVNECYQPHTHATYAPVTGHIFSNNTCIASGVQEAYIKFANDGTTGTSDVSIIGNTLQGGFIWISSDTTGAVSKILISNNTINTTDQTASIYNTGGSVNTPEVSVQITGNKITNAAGAGISLAAPSHLIIEGNRVENTTASGITIANANTSINPEIIISNNMVIDTATSSGNALYFSTSAANTNRLTIEGNHFINATANQGGAVFSMSAAGSTTTADFIGNTVVNSNIVTSGYAGLTFKASGNTIYNYSSGAGAVPAFNIGGNTNAPKIINNTIDTGNYYGIDMQSNNFEISQNVFNNITFQTVLNIGGSNGLVNGNTILNQVSTGGTDYGLVIGGDRVAAIGNVLVGGATIENGIRLLAGADATRLFGNNVDGYAAQVVNLGTNTYMRGNFGAVSGYMSDNGGVTSVADGGTIAHGMGVTPTFAICSASAANHICQITAKDATNLTIGLIDHAGATIAAAENVYWMAVK